MDFYETERRRGTRVNAQPMWFDNTACFEMEVQSDSNGGWPPRFVDRSSSGHQLTNAFHFNDNQSSTGTTYSVRPEGHIYEEVGPPSHPPPYFCTGGDMDGRIPSIHQTLDHQHHLRGSPSSLCSMCSRQCNGQGTQPSPSPPTLPMCNCMSHGMQQPFCNHHGPLVQPQVPTRTLNNGHINRAQQCSPTCTLHTSPVMTDQLHHGTPCTLHQHNSMVGMSNQRYTAPAGTTTPDTTLQNSQQENNSKPKDRSLSPFAFLRKYNRDSKASTNTMLDNSSGKSVLMCSRRWLVAILLTLGLIVVLSVAVGLVVTFVVQKSEEVSASTSTSSGPQPTVRETSRIEGLVRVVKGINSVYSAALDRSSSIEYRDYTKKFEEQTKQVLQNHPLVSSVVRDVKVQKLSNGSVSVNFIVYLQQPVIEQRADNFATSIKQILIKETNRTDHSSSFNNHFGVDPSSISTSTVFGNYQPTIPKWTTHGSESRHPPITTPINSVSTIKATSVPTTPETYTTPPASGICQPITNEICQKIHYNSSGTTFPNFAGHRDQGEAAVLITVLNAVMATTSCYDNLNTFSCALLAPKCGTNHTRIPPCKRLCEAAFDKCRAYMEQVMSSEVAHINCSWFPDSTDPEVCVDEQSSVVPTATPSCPTNFFPCTGGLCRPMKDRCDSVEDCSDGSDEQNCENFECVPGQFRCNNGDCLPKVWQCDGRNDCADNSDEDGCEPTPPCQRGEFKCRNGYNVWKNNHDEETAACLESRYTCDKTRDCTDGSDEDEEFCKDRLTTSE